MITPDFEYSALANNKSTNARSFIDVLVLYDNHTNQAAGHNATAIPGIVKINSVLTNSGINAEFSIVAVDKLPASLCGGGSTPCYHSYTKHLNDITESQDILGLRIKHKADVAVVMRSTKYGDLNFQTTGMANLTITQRWGKDLNDPIVRYYWFVLKVGEYNKLIEREYGSATTDFCWTPASSQIGSYRVYLSVRDNRGANKLIGKALFLKYDPDYISAPVLYLNNDNGSYITLTWSTPRTGSPAYYEIHRKIDANNYRLAATSSLFGNIETFFHFFMSGEENYYKIRGCTSDDKCGLYSNELQYHVGKGESGSQPAFL